MKSTAHRKSAVVAGLLLALLLSAVAAQAALALNDQGSGVGGGVRLASATIPAAGTQGRGGIAAVLAPAPGVAAVPASASQAGGGIASAVAAAPAASQSTSTSSTTWIAIVLSLAALFVGVVAWALINNRRRPAESSLADFCARYPEDPVCGAA